MNRCTIAVLAAGLAVSGCVSMAPDTEVPAVVEAMPESFSNGQAGGEFEPVNWWIAFEDPVLDMLVERALSDNLDLASAAARAERAAAQARVSRASLLPSLDASLGGSYSDTPIAGGAFAGFPGAPSRINNETYSFGLAAAYELDLFGRIRGGDAASRADALAAEQDFRAARLAVAAETISAYFDVVDARHQIALSIETLDVLGDRVARTEERYHRGLVESFELYQVRQELRGVESNLPLRESALSAVEARLALLVAQYPGELNQLLGPRLQPRLVFDDVPAGLPAALLDQRPDVAAAWQRLEAARLRVGASRAERFPSLRLTGSTGTQGAAAPDVFDIGQNWLLQLGVNLVAPIFDGGRISANIHAARANYEDAASAYGNTVLQAFGEVEVALSSYEEQRQRYRLVTAQLAEAQATLDLQSERYASGVVGYIAYLDAIRAYYQVQSTLSSVARDVAQARLGVHRALGGDWTSNGELE